jgi:hypothetical protein
MLPMTSGVSGGRDEPAFCPLPRHSARYESVPHGCLVPPLPPALRCFLVLPVSDFIFYTGKVSPAAFPVYCITQHPQESKKNDRLDSSANAGKIQLFVQHSDALQPRAFI